MEEMKGGTVRGRARAAETGLGAEAGAGSVASCMMKEEQSLVIFKKCTPVFPNLFAEGTPTVLNLYVSGQGVYLLTHPFQVLEPILMS